MAELYIPDLIGAMERGYKSGQERRRTRTLAQNYMGATQGDQNALAQVYGVDPEAGMQAQTFGLQQRRAQRQEADDDIIRASKFYLQTKSPQAWAYLHQKFSSDSRFPPMPAKIESPEDQEGSMQFASALVNSMGGGEGQNVQSRFINDRGEMVALMRDGSTRVVGKADPSMQIIEGEGGFFGVNRRNLSAAPVQLGGPAVAQPQMPTQGTMESDIEQANQMIQQGRPPEEVDEWLASRGQQVPESMPMGQLRPKQQQISPAEAQRLQMERERLDMQRQEADARRQANAVTGKAPTEGERAAFGYLERMQAASQLISGIEQSGYDPGNYRDYVSANNAGMSVLGPVFNSMMSDEGQKYRQAQEDWVRAKLRKESGAVIGDEEMAREIRVYFPQPGDSPQVIQQKAVARKQAERQLMSMAGRAVPSSQPAARAGAQQPAPASQPRRLKFNPQTGKIE